MEINLTINLTSGDSVDITGVSDRLEEAIREEVDDVLGFDLNDIEDAESVNVTVKRNAPISDDQGESNNEQSKIKEN